MCDFLAENGYLVIMPDFYRGDMCDPAAEPDRIGGFIKDVTKWPSLKLDWEKKVKPYAEKHGAKTYGSVGTCWGSYVVLRLAEDVGFNAGVSFHPSHSPISGMILQVSTLEYLINVQHALINLLQHSNLHDLITSCTFILFLGDILP